VDDEKRSKLIDEIEMKLLNWESVEIPSREIAEIVMEVLKSTDPVAYIRFATIYKNIKNIADFQELIDNFQKTNL